MNAPVSSTETREVDPDERLDQHARADHLRDEVEGDDASVPIAAAVRAGRWRRRKAQDVGDRVLAALRMRSASRNITVRNATRKPTEYRNPSKP